ncbi:hypothetical protein Agub_g6147 [Astrephomene gubernaculifera]|uniref:Uncharacterized protein n=1 Tax=Astrephomene gubernaculifera TaxID=47775 RepID=A0AAD3HLB7_9CHLO|nr:hypothetical protein Agub_g6147 [Astrephomene gubernaculifera]
MVSCPGTSSIMLSPRPSKAGGLRGVSKLSGYQPAAKAKKVQRALCTIFEENALGSSPFYPIKGWLASPGAQPQQSNNAINPALGRVRMQEYRDTPALRKATPVKDKRMAMRARFGRHRLQGDLDALADELGTCQLKSALKPAPPQHGLVHGLSRVEPLTMSMAQDD